MPEHRQTVLLIVADPPVRAAIRCLLGAAGFAVAESGSGAAALDWAQRRSPDAALLDASLSDIAAADVLRRLRELDPAVPVVVAGAPRPVPGPLAATRGGAIEVIDKPWRDEQLLAAVRRAVARRGAASCAGGARAALAAVMGTGPAIQSLADRVQAVAATDYSVLILGETGAGKEVVAQCLHRQSLRARRSLVVVDCGSVVETLVDSEFFGAEKGAYTGAGSRRLGWFEAAAAGGTIFLDEIGNLCLAGQKTLLRALEQRVIHRVGGTAPVSLDLRVIAATNEQLDGRIANGVFREDLFFRLAEYVIEVPPLRARTDDIEYLAQRFLDEARRSLGRPPAEIAGDALDLLCGHDWPGNVRELRNVVRRAALTAGDRIAAGHIAGCLGRRTPSAPARAPDAVLLRGRVRDKVREVERAAVFEALEQAGGNKAQAARLLGIDYKTYRTKLKTLGGSPVANGYDARA